MENRCGDCTYRQMQRCEDATIQPVCVLSGLRKWVNDGCKEWEAKQYTLDDSERLVGK